MKPKRQPPLADLLLGKASHQEDPQVTLVLTLFLVTRGGSKRSIINNAVCIKERLSHEDLAAVRRVIAQNLESFNDSLRVYEIEKERAQQT